MKSTWSWHWLAHPLVILVVTGLALAFSWSLWQTRQRFSHAQEYTHQLEAAVQNLGTDVDQLAATTRQASTSANQERIIRDQLLMQQPGDVVIQLPPLPPLPSPSPDPTPPTPWQAWQDVLNW